MTRRQERTTDPDRLFGQLAADATEIAEYARRQIGRSPEPERLRAPLDALYFQLRNCAAQVSEARGSIEEATKYGGLPEWDVVAEGETARGQIGE